MSIFFTFNDKFFTEGTPVINPDNRSFRYGDGLFETLKINQGIIQLSDYHFERLFAGMQLLQFEIPKHFTATHLQEKIIELCKKNKHTSFARVRLTVFRGSGGLYDPKNNFPNYIIQTWPIEESIGLHSNGLIIDVYTAAKKSCDNFANLKSNNFLPYAMAAIYAKQIKVNDCIVLNNYERICDTTIANIFVIKNDVIYTPPLSEGCIAGVTRRSIIEKLQPGFTIVEKALSIEDVKNADEIFLTNSIKGIRWVKQFGESQYKNILVRKIHDHFIKTIQ